MKATKIYLAIPSSGATVHAGILDFVSQIRGGLFKYGGRTYELETGIVAHVSPIEAARNALVYRFFQTDCDWLFFLDADVYPAESGLMILDAIDQADIITGRVMIWMPEKEGENWHLQPTAAVKIGNGTKHLIQDVGTGPIRYDVEGTGTGCLLINRKVLEDRRMWGPTKYIHPGGEEKELGEKDPPPIFRTYYQPNGRRILGEDYWFSSLAKGLGYRIAYVPYAHYHHFKPLSLLDVEKYSNASYTNGFRFGKESAVGEKSA